MNDVRLYYVDEHRTARAGMKGCVAKLTTQTVESEIIAAAGVVVEGEQFDLVGLDRIVDPDTGEVSYNVGIWFDDPDDHEGDWRTIYTIDADMVRRRLAARQALDDAGEGPFQAPDDPTTDQGASE